MGFLDELPEPGRASDHHHGPGWEPQASERTATGTTLLLAIKLLEAIAMPAAKMVKVWTLPCSRLWAKPVAPARPEPIGDQGAGQAINGRAWAIRGRAWAIPLGQEPLQSIPGFAVGVTERPSR